MYAISYSVIVREKKRQKLKLVQLGMLPGEHSAISDPLYTWVQTGNLITSVVHPISDYYPIRVHRKRDTLLQHCFEAGPPSTTVAQHQNNSGSTSRVSWDIN